MLRLYTLTIIVIAKQPGPVIITIINVLKIYIMKINSKPI